MDSFDSPSTAFLGRNSVGFSTEREHEVILEVRKKQNTGNKHVGKTDKIHGTHNDSK